MSIVTRRARRIRERLKLTLLDVHGKTGVKPDRLSRFELNQRLLRYDALKVLARFYSRRAKRKITIDELLAVETNGASPKEATA